MPDLDPLRSLADQLVPPSFGGLRETARRRTRRDADAVAVAAAAAAVAVIAGGALVAAMDETAPEPGPSVCRRRQPAR